tara:strand:- start:382 stop:558 length:177 start_codon:yes stop_codon:yes gene_type:complete
MLYVQWAQKTGVHLSGVADCLPHYLRPEGFALPVIKQEVAVIQQAGNTKRSKTPLKYW